MASLTEAFEQLRESEEVVHLYESRVLPAADANVREAQAAYTNNRVPFLTLVAVTQETDEKRLIQRANERLKGFPGYIRVRRVVTTREPWTVENGLLTPTLKVKRERVQEKFRTEIERAYAAGALD